jgi:microcystin-dependent protein
LTAYNVVDPGKLVAGQPEDVSVLLANLQAIAAVLNGSLDNANLSPAAAIAISKLAGYPADNTKTLLGDGTWGNPAVAVGGAIPTGTVLPFAAAVAPTGYLLCDGAAVSRTTYAGLFALVGTIYGVGDGSTTFNVPDVRGRVIAGYSPTGHADITVMGATEGNAVGNRRVKHSHTNQLSASPSGLTLPNHGHAISINNHDIWIQDAGDVGAGGQMTWVLGPTTPGGSSETRHGTEAFGHGGASVGNPTSNPAIGGSITLSGAIGITVQSQVDQPASIMLNHIIKT